MSETDSSTGLGEGEGVGRKENPKSWAAPWPPAAPAVPRWVLGGPLMCPVSALLSAEGIGLQTRVPCQTHLARHSNRGLFRRPAAQEAWLVERVRADSAMEKRKP